MKIPGQWLRTGVALTMLVSSLLCGSASAQTPVVRIDATWPETSEPYCDAHLCALIAPGRYTISRNAAGNQPLVVHLQYLGSAMSGSDYDPLPSTVTIPAGALSATVDVIPLSDANANEGEENVVANLKPPPPGTVQTYTLDPQNWAEVVIHDGPSVPMPPLITITGTTATPEFCGPNMDCPGIHFRLTRTEPGIDKPLTVRLRYEGTATSGVDYHALPASVTFAAGQANALLDSLAIDDTLVEGDETVIAVIADPPPATAPNQPAYRHFHSSDRSTVVIRDNDGPPVLPVVTIRADGFPAKTAEPCPVCLVSPVTVTVSRSGPLDHDLHVGLRTGGTATSGVDYHPVPGPFVIPAGKASASFLLNALDDALPEGPEIVEIAIQPVMAGGAGYIVGDPGSVYAVIGDDDEGAPSERFDIVKPANNAVLPSGVPSIAIRALAISTRGEIDHPAQFYANGVLIGQSNPPQYGRPSIPCLPREHDIVWNSPANGQYTLTARVEYSLNQWLETPPVHITVGQGQQRPVISIVATGRIAEEDSAPTMRVFVYRGEFTVSRTGSTANPQTVYLHVSGTAVSGADYRPLPFAVSIPAGSASTKVIVEAIPDNIAEPLETVVAEVSNCPPDHLMPPCFDFEIDAANARDTVFIRDDGITRATLEITAPQKGAHFSTGQDVTIDCTAIDIDGAMTTVDFYAGNQKIGESVIYFFVEPEPGSPIMHSFTWTGAPAGTHTLTTQATASGGERVVSAPVTITVGSNLLPAVQLTSPATGAQIPSGTPIELTAAATDPDGYTNYAEFFANGHKLGEVRLDFLVPPPPGETQTFTFTWRDAPPGSHMLSARVRDDGGAHGVSPPVTITVTAADNLPVVVVFPADPFAREPSAGSVANTASFRLKRYGSTTNDLAVNYSMHGSATNGTDYPQLNGTAVFPAGQSSVPVVVTPLADILAEGRETVILQVEPQFDDGPERYRVGHHRRAIAVIADAHWTPPHPGGEHCSSLGAGLFHLCFPASPAQAFRVEASDDLRQWETVHEASSIDAAIHYVDPDTPGLKNRFYRMVEDPAAASP